MCAICSDSHRLAATCAVHAILLKPTLLTLPDWYAPRPRDKAQLGSFLSEQRHWPDTSCAIRYTMATNRGDALKESTKVKMFAALACSTDVCSWCLTSISSASLVFWSGRAYVAHVLQLRPQTITVSYTCSMCVCSPHAQLCFCSASSGQGNLCLVDGVIGQWHWDRAIPCLQFRMMGN